MGVLPQRMRGDANCMRPDRKMTGVLSREARCRSCPQIADFDPSHGEVLFSQMAGPRFIHDTPSACEYRVRVLAVDVDAVPRIHRSDADIGATAQTQMVLRSRRRRQ